MDEDELREHLLALGLTLDDDGDWFEEFLVETDPPIMPVADQRWVWLPALLEGRTFTHRLSETEVEHDLVATLEDLAPVEVLIGDPPYDRFTDGADATVVYPSDPALGDRAIDAEAVSGGAILLERGRLAGLGLGVGDIVGVRVEQDGLELLAVGEASGTSTGQALAALVGESPDRPHLIENSVWAVCAADNDLLRRPELPLGEQLESCGVARRGSLIATEGYDFDAGEAEEILRRIQEEHDLDELEAVAVVQLLQIVVGMTLDSTRPWRQTKKPGSRKSRRLWPGGSVPRRGPASPRALGSKASGPWGSRARVSRRRCRCCGTPPSRWPSSTRLWAYSTGSPSSSLR